MEFGPHVHVSKSSQPEDCLTTEHLASLPVHQEAPLSVTCQSARSMIVTSDCEISNPKRAQNRVVICPVRLLSTLSREKQGDAKRGRIAHLFFLPRHGDKLEDSVVYLNHLTTIDIDLILNIPRVVTLHVIGRRALYAQFLRWLSRWELVEVPCPKCGTLFNAPAPSAETNS